MVPRMPLIVPQGNAHELLTQLDSIRNEAPHLGKVLDVGKESKQASISPNLPEMGFSYVPEPLNWVSGCFPYSIIFKREALRIAQCLKSFSINPKALRPSTLFHYFFLLALSFGIHICVL